VATATRIQLGAPGIYAAPETQVHVLTGVRMDVCAFVGVAPRGPSRVPVVDERWRDDIPCVEPERPVRRSVAMPVESWDDYRRLYGGFEGPGLLPYAVASFFEQGGRRAYIVRVVHDYDGPGDLDGVGRSRLRGLATGSGRGVRLRARNEGAWGNSLRASLSFEPRPLSVLDADTASITVAAGTPLPPGTLLRIALAGGQRVLRFVTQVRQLGRLESAQRDLVATLGTALTGPSRSVEVVDATLRIDDRDGRSEEHRRLALAAQHPRYLATVMCWESELLYPIGAWVGRDVLPADTSLPPAETNPFRGGSDRYGTIVPEDGFEPRWTPGWDGPASGVHALVDVDDVSLLVVPDLYSPAPLAEHEAIVEPRSLAGPTFETCVDLPPPPVQARPTSDLRGLRLDPTLPSERKLIAELQLRLESLAETLRSFVVLLDVPPGLHQRAILDWRSRFTSSFAAAYHPWLRVARGDDSRNAVIRVNPSAIAAGMIAQREALYGVPFGPSNELAAGVVDIEDAVSPPRHDELHPAGVNVFLRERDGIRLTAARTLAGDPDYRQLSVRRLMTMLRRVLQQQTQWMVFEPNSASLRSDVELMLESYLRSLYRANAFRGASESEAFFVRCDDALNPPAVVDAGRLVVEVGVAPAEPLEFIVLRLSRDGDGTVRTEGAGA
jgi:hypothetical protein